MLSKKFKSKLIASKIMPNVTLSISHVIAILTSPHF